MSSFISPGQQYLQSIISVQDFDALYDKYGSVVYGWLLKLVNHHPGNAEMLMHAVFVELYTVKRSDIETEQVSFAKMLQLVIAIAGRNGYDATACIKAICIPYRNRLAITSTDAPASMDGALPVYE